MTSLRRTCSVHIRRTVIIAGFSLLTLSTIALSHSTGILERKIPVKNNLIIFPNEKGEVIFSHAIHSKKFKESDCILCHRSNQPTREKVLSRFDNPRIAHYFCKGCHREMGSGPTECHQCHNYKKTS